MDLETLLNKYFDGKPELAQKKEALINKALQLVDQLEQEKN